MRGEKQPFQRYTVRGFKASLKNRWGRLLCLTMLTLVFTFSVNAGDWSDPMSPSGLPGSGNMQSQNAFISPDGTELIQGFWRGNQGWSRTVPIVGGVIQWSSASAWSGPIPLSALPGSGSIQSQTGFLSPDETELIQGFWRGNQGWSRTVPVINDSVSWSNASAWSGPMSISALPGSGNIMAQASFLLPNSGKLLQRFWRGNQCYWRVVPVSNGKVDWSHASAWFGPISISTLPGSGDMQSLAAYMLPNEKDLQEGFWRGNLGYVRTLKLKDGNGFILNPTGTSHLGWIFDTDDWTAYSGSSLHIGDDYYADDWFKNDGNTEGQDAYAMAPGIVIYAGPSPSGWSYGNQVVVQCVDDPTFAYRYAHLQSVNVSVGEFIGLDTVLGRVGHTGGDFGAHLHSVLYKNIQPNHSSLNYLKQGKSPSGYISGGPSGPSQYAAPFYNDAGNPVTAIIVDDGDTGFYMYGPSQYWHRESIGYGSDMYWTYVNGSVVSNYVRWKPQLAGAGYYKVQVFIPRNHATTYSAKYKVLANGVTYNPSPVAQINYYDQWVTLGTYYFNSSNTGSEYVQLTDATGEAGSTYRKIGFDAVKWIKQ